MHKKINDYDITVVKSFEEIEKIRQLWTSMQNHPNSDIDHYVNFMKYGLNNAEPYILLLAHFGCPKSIIIGRIENDYSFQIKIGHKRIFNKTVKTLTIIYGGFLGELTVESSKYIFKEIMNLLDTAHVDLVRINYLNVNSEIYKLFSTKPYILRRDLLQDVNTHWRMHLPKNIEDFFKVRSKKHRYWLRRIKKRFEQEYPDKINYVVINNDDNLSPIFRDINSISSQTYQRHIGAGFIDTEKTRKIYLLLAALGRLRVYMIYIKDKPCAYWIGEHYQETFYLHSTGYLPEYEKYEIGTILFTKMLEDLCTLGTIQFLDFGFGDAAYKSRFGDESWRETSLYIFSKRYDSVKLNILRYMTLGSYRLVLRALKKMNLLDKLKKVWRKS